MGSLSRASLSLHIAQPALSQQLARLEEDLGVRLLNRSVRGVTPTESGRAFYKQAQFILKQVEQARISAREADAGPAGPVAIGLPWSIAHLLGLELLSEMQRNFPSVRLELVEGPSSFLGGLLATGKLDLAVLFDENQFGGLEIQPLLEEPLLLVGTKGSFKNLQAASLADVASLPLLMLSAPNRIREQLDEELSTANLKPHVVAEINAPHLLQQAISKGLGFSVLPASGIEEWVRQGLLEAIPLSGLNMARTVSLAHSRLFPLSVAADCVSKLFKRLVINAIERRRWRGELLDFDVSI